MCKKGVFHMVVFMAMAFLIFWGVVFFLICRKKKHGKAIFICLMLGLMSGFVRYETTRGNLRTFADMDDAYHAYYEGELKLVLDGTKTKLLVGVDGNDVKCYMMVRQNSNGTWRIVLDSNTKTLLLQNGVLVEEVGSGVLGEHYLTILCPTQTRIEPDDFNWIENQSLPEDKNGYAYVQPDGQGVYMLEINGERMIWRL